MEIEYPYSLTTLPINYRFHGNSLKIFLRRLPKPVTILPGDQITAECVYDTNWKGGKSVIGGQSTDDEMCKESFFIFPWQPIKKIP